MSHRKDWGWFAVAVASWFTAYHASAQDEPVSPTAPSQQSSNQVAPATTQPATPTSRPESRSRRFNRVTQPSATQPAQRPQSNPDAPVPPSDENPDPSAPEAQITPATQEAMNERLRRLEEMRAAATRAAATQASHPQLPPQPAPSGEPQPAPDASTPDAAPTQPDATPAQSTRPRRFSASRPRVEDAAEREELRRRAMASTQRSPARDDVSGADQTAEVPAAEAPADAEPGRTIQPSQAGKDIGVPPARPVVTPPGSTEPRVSGPPNGAPDAGATVDESPRPSRPTQRPTVHTPTGGNRGGVAPGAAAHAATDAPVAPPRPRDETKTSWFNFKDMPWEDIVELMARRIGKPLMKIGVMPGGNLTYENSAEMTTEEALDELNFLLAMEGYFIKEEDKYVYCLPLNELKKYIEPREMYDSIEEFDAANPRDREFCSVNIRIKGMPADMVKERTAPAMPDHALPTVVPGSNSINITGLAQDVRRFKLLLASIDPRPDDPREMKQYRIKTNVLVVERMVRELLNVAEPVRTFNPQTRQFEVKGADTLTKIIADERTNSLIVKATPHEHVQVQDLIDRFDVKPEDLEFKTVVREVKHGNATEIANMLNQIFQQEQGQPTVVSRFRQPQQPVRPGQPVPAQPGQPVPQQPTPQDIFVEDIFERAKKTVRIVADDRTNSLVIYAHKEGVKRVDDMLDIIDKPVPANYRTFILKNARPEQIQPMIEQIARSMATQTSGRVQRQPTIVADDDNRALHVIAQREELDRIARLIEQIDVPSERDKQHIVKLQNMRPSEMAQTIQNLLAQSGGPAAPRPGRQGVQPRRGGSASTAQVFALDEIQTLIVFCSDEDWEKVRGTIEMWDANAISDKPLLKFFPITRGSPDAIKETVTALYRQYRHPVLGPAPVFVDVTGEQVVVQAIRPAMEEIESLIPQLDVEISGNPLVIIPVQNADATQLVTLVQQQVQLRGPRGAAARPSSINADPATNSLIVQADKPTLAMIKEFVANYESQLVGQAPEKRTYTMQHVAPDEVVNALTSFYGGGGGRFGGAQRQVKVLKTGSQVLVEAPKDKFAEIDRIIAQIDVTPGSLVTEVRPIPQGLDPTSIANLLSQAFRAQPPRPDRLQFSFNADPTTSQILMTVPKDGLAQADELLKKFTDVSGNIEQVEKFVTVQHADAGYVVEKVRQLLAARSGFRGGVSLTDRVKVEVDTRLNRVVYYAPQSLVPLVEGLIRELDQVIVDNAGQITAFPLKYADAQNVAQIVNNIWAEKLKTNRLLKIQAEPSSNTVYVSGAMKADLDELRLRLDDFDKQALESRPATRIFEIANANPWELIQTLQARFQQPGGNFRRQQAFQFNVVGGASIVAIAPGDRMDEIAALIADIDVPAAPQPMQRIALKHADAQTVAGTLTNLLAPELTTKRTLKIVAEPMTNAIVVTGASRSDFERISGLAREIDEGTVSLQAVTRTFEILSANAQDLVPILTDRFGARAGQQQRNAPKFSVMGGVNIVATAPPDRMPEIAKAIADLDIKPANEFPPVAIELTNADPSETASMIERIFGRNRPGAGNNPALQAQVTVANNTLIVRAPEKVLADVKDLIKKIDVPNTDMLTVKMFDLKVMRATDLEVKVNLFLSTLGTNTRRGAMKPGCFAEPATNTLIVFAPKEYMPFIEGLIAQIEAKELPSSEPRSHALRIVRADQVAANIEAMLKAKVAEQEGPKNDRVQVKVLPEPVGNRLFVYAPEDYHELAAKLVRMVDTEVDTGEITHIIRLEQADAAAIANVVTQRGQKAGGKPTVTAIADAGSNSVILQGLPKDLAEMEKTIQELEQNSVSIPELQIFKIRHTSTTKVLDALEKMFPPQTRNPSDAVTISEDKFYSRLYVTANKRKMRQIEAIIEQIDTKPETVEGDLLDGRVLEFVTINRGDAFDIAFEVSDFFPPESDGGPSIDADWFGEYITVKCRPDELDKIVSLIRKYEARAKRETTFRQRRLKTSDLAKLAPLLQGQFPDLQFEIAPADKARPSTLVEELWKEGEYPPGAKLPGDKAESVKVKPVGDDASPRNVSPFLLGGAFLDAWLDGVQRDLSAAIGVQPPDQPERPAPPPPAPGDRATDRPDPDRPSTPPAETSSVDGAKITILPDGRIGIFGDKKKVESIEDALDLLEEDLASGEVIRIFKFKYGDVTAAANILGLMFNNQAAGGAAAIQQQMQAMQQMQQMQQMQAMQQQQNRGGGRGGRGGDDDRGGGLADQMRALMGGAAGGQPQQQSGRGGRGGAQQGGQRLRIATDISHNYLIVKCDESDLPEIRQLLREMDIPPANVDVKVIQLKNLDARETAENIKAVMGIDRSGTRGQPGGRGAANPFRGGGQMNPQMQLMELMQQQMMSVQGAEGVEGAKIDSVEIVPNEVTNSLLVSAPREVMKIIEEVIENLEDLEGRTTHVVSYYKLEQSKVEEILPLLQEIFDATSGGAAGRGGAAARRSSPADLGPVTISGDSRTNTIIFVSQAKDVRTVRDQIQKLDVTGDFAQAESFVLNCGDAVAIAQVVSELFGGAAAGGAARPGRRGGGDATTGNPTEVRITAEGVTNTIVVFASTEMRNKIFDKVEELDKLSCREIREIPVVFGDPEKLADKLMTIFGGVNATGTATGGRRGPGGDAARQMRDVSGRIVIVGDKISKKILVRAPDTIYKQMNDLVAALDKADPGLQLHSYALKHADAQVVVEAVQQAFLQYQAIASQTGDRDATSNIDAFVPVADPRTNTVHVVGSDQTFAFVSRILSAIDVETPKDKAKQFRLFVLDQADAQTVADAINGFAAGQAALAAGAQGARQPGARRGGGGMLSALTGGGGLGNAPLLDVQAIADPVNNAVLVFGKLADIETVDVAVIQEYDKGLRGRLQFATIRVANAQPSELLAFIQPYLDQFSVAAGDPRSGGRAAGAAQHAPIVLPNDNARTIEVRGSSGQIREIETLVARFDNKDLITSNVQIIPLPTGQNAAAVAQTLERVVNDGERRQAQRNNRQPREITVQADDYTNSLLVYADPSQIGMVKAIVKELGDVRTGNMQTRVLTLRNLSSSDAQQLINDLQQRRAGQTGRGTGGFRQTGGQGQVAPGGQPGAQPGGGMRGGGTNQPRRGGGGAGGGQGNRPRGGGTPPYDGAMLDASPGSPGAGSTFVGTFVLPAVAWFAPQDAEDDDEVDEEPLEIAAAAQNQPAPRVPAPNPPPPDAQTQPAAPLVGVTGQLRGEVFATPVDSQTIVLWGDEADLEFIEQMLMLMELSTPEMKFEIFPLEFASAATLQPVIEQTLQAMLERAGAGVRDRFAIIAEGRSNSLIVSATAPNIDRVREIIRALDIDKMVVSQPRLVKLDHIRASEAANLLRPYIEKMAAREGRPQEARPEVQAIDHLNSVMIIGTSADVSEIERIIRGIDVEMPPTDDFTVAEILLIDLKNAVAETLAATLEQLIAAEFAAGTTGAAGPAARGGPAANSMVRRLLLTTADGRELPPLDLNRPIKILPDKARNALAIYSSRKNNEALHEIVTAFDSLPSGVEIDVKSFTLNHASAKAVADALQKFFDDTKRTLTRPAEGDQKVVRDGVMPPVPENLAGGGLAHHVVVSHDPRSNSVFVVGRKPSVLLAAGLITELDKPAGDLNLQPRILKLQNLGAAAMETRLRDMLDKRTEALGGKDAAGRDNAIITVDDRSNALIVFSTDDTWRMIEGLASQLDRLDSYTPVVMRFRKLVYADGAKLAGLLQDAFDKKKEARGAAKEGGTNDTLSVLADPRSNALLLTGTRDYADEAEALIADLDKPMTGTIEVKLRELKFNSAANIARLLTDMVTKSREGQSTTGGGAGVKGSPVHVAAETYSNILLMAASKEDMILLDRWIDMLDKPEQVGRKTRIVPLSRTNADTLSKSVSDLIKAGAATGGTGAGASAGADVTIFGEKTTNSVVVIGPPQVVDDTVDLLMRLDTTEATANAIVRFFKLEQADAETAGNLLRSILEGRSGTVGGSRTGGTTGGAATGTAQAEAAESVLLIYQKQHPELGAETLRGMRNAVKVIDDQRTNSLVISAPPDSMPLVESLVAAIDVPPDAAKIRVFPLRNSDAAKMVEMLEKLIPTSTTTGTGTTGRAAQPGDQERQLVLEGGAAAGGRQELSFTTDTRTNSVIAAGTKGYLDLVEQLIYDLDTRPIPDRETLVYHPSNNKATEIESAITSYSDKEKTRLAELGTEVSAQEKMSREIVAISSEETNRIVLSFDPRRKAEVLDLVRELDQAPPQVMIQTLILEVTLDNSLELGVEFAFQDLQFTKAGPNDTTSFDYVGGTDLGAAVGDLGGFTFTITGKDFNFLLRTLQGESTLNVISRPQVIAADNQVARIEVTNDVPYVGGSTITSGGQVTTSVEREEVGVKLEVTPHINPDGFVRMEIRQEVSDLTDSSVTVGQGITAPIFFRRIAETVVTVKDNETVVLGGLITTRESSSEQKVPILGDVPGLGLLFSDRNRRVQRTELLIVMTPRIIRTVDDYRALSIEERNRTGVIPPETLQSPLLQGLRVRPEDFAPQVPEGDADRPAPLRERPQPPVDEEIYGPQRKNSQPDDSRRAEPSYDVPVTRVTMGSRP